MAFFLYFTWAWLGILCVPSEVESFICFALILCGNYDAVMDRNALYALRDKAVDDREHDACILSHQPHPGVRAKHFFDEDVANFQGFQQAVSFASACERRFALAIVRERRNCCLERFRIKGSQ